MKKTRSNIEILWGRHYEEGITGSFLGDMAYTYSKMLQDRDCNGETREKLHNSIRSHVSFENKTNFVQNEERYFTKQFGANF